MSAGAQSAWKPPDADRQPSAWSPPESDRTPTPTFGQQLLNEAVINPLKQVGAGALGASATANKITANIADAAEWLVRNTAGIEAGAPLRNLSQWARQNQEAQQKQAAELSGGRNDLASQLYRGGTQGLLEIPQYVAAGTVAGPVAGMAIVGAVTEADKGWWPAVQAAAEGALTGGALHVMGPASRAVRLTGAAAMAYAQARLNGADNTTALAHATTMGVMAGATPGGVTAREFVPGLDTALTTAERAGTAAKAGAKAAAPDVAMGTAKAGGGYLAGEIAGMVPGGGFVRHVLDLPTALVGGRQIGRGLKKGVAAARASYAETAPTVAPPAEPAARPTAGPAGAPTDDALLQLYSVETNPAKRSALQAQLIDRGLMNPPGAAPTTPPEANPYRGYSQDALRKVYAIEPDPAKLALIEQAARNRGLSLLSREGRRATAAVPETGAAEARGPSLTQDEALMLRFMGTEDPLSASTADIATARKLAIDNPELLRRLRAGEPEPAVAQPTPAEKAVIAQPPTQAVQAPLPPALQSMLEKAQQTGEFTPEETARAAAILENVEPQATPTAQPPAAVETPLSWARAEIVDRGGQLPAVSEIQRRFKMGYGAATDVLREAQGLRPKGEPIVTPPPAAPPPAPAQPTPPPPAAVAPAAPQPQTVGSFMREAPPTPGRVFAESQGYDWAKLSADDRAALEHVAQAQANMAEQQLPVTPPAAQTQSAGEFMRGEPASELESQLADSLAAVKARKQPAPETPPAAPAAKPENIYAKNNRLAKAVRVTDAAQEAGLTSFDVYKMKPDDFAAKVGEKSISADTMAMVVDKLRKLEADAARGGAAPKAVASFKVVKDPAEPGLWNVDVKIGNQSIGTMELIDHAHELEIDLSHLTPKYRGQGYGKAMYQEAMKHAQQLGKRYLTSGSEFTEDAARVWRSLGGEQFTDAAGDTRWRLPVPKTRPPITDFNRP
jgi:GNAT superfamily N-acetyltransferase